MIYEELISQIEAMLIGDVKFTKICDERRVLLQESLDKVATEADSLYLRTLIDERFGNDFIILRSSGGGSYIRQSYMDGDGFGSTDCFYLSDSVDIDDQLTTAVARFVCMSVSKLKPKFHEEIGMRIIRRFNENIISQIEELEQYNDDDSFGTTNRFARVIV